jgi:diguanylate cyclase (GGDEF)-like protein/PAS domain S-box-containing protein
LTARSAARLAVCGAAPVFALAAAVLVGWLLDHEALKRGFFDGVVMLPDTALGLLLAAVALAASARRGAAARRWAAVAASASLLIGALQCIEIATVLVTASQDFDLSLLPQPPYPLPPSPQTALSLLLAGAALLLAVLRPASSRYAAWAALPIFLTGLVGIQAYALGAKEILLIRGFAALPAAATVSFLLLGAAIPLAVLDEDSLPFSKRGGSMMLRRLLPAAFVITTLGAGLLVTGVERHWFGLAEGGALFAGTCFALLLLLTLKAAADIDRLEADKDEIGESYRSIVDTAPDGILVVDETGGIVMANRRAEALFGYGENELVGVGIETLVPEGLRQRHAALREDYLARPTQRRMGSGPGTNLRARRKDGSEFVANISLGPRQTRSGLTVTAIVHDVSGTVRHEIEIDRVNRALRLLTAAAQAMRGAQSEIELLETLCRIVIEVGGYRFAFIGFADDDERKTVQPVAWSGFEDGFLDELVLTRDDSPSDCDTAGTALRSGRHVVVRSIASAASVAPWRESLLKRGYASVAAFPLRIEGVVQAVLVIYAATEDAFGEEECTLLEDLAADIGYGIAALRAAERSQQAETALRRSEATLARAQQIAHIGSWEWDLETNAVHWSVEAFHLFGLHEDEAEPSLELVLARTHPDDRAELERCLLQAREGSVSATRCEHRILWEDGTMRWVHMQAEVEFHDAGPYRNVGVIQDISERKRFEEKLSQLASHDALTGLPNRHLLQDRLEQGLAHHRYTERILALLFVDLDRFKIINDTLGHDAGDLLLKEIARRLSSCLREGDTVARQGGDEFVVVLTDLAKAEDAAFVAQKILDALAPPCLLAGREVLPAASLGIALYPQDGKNIQELMMSADKAMYAAKQAGRGQYRFFDPAMNRAAADWLEVGADLHHALARGEFELHYQPKVSLKSGAITGVEALLRWRRPEGLVPPNKFIPILEETGLILEVGEWVIARACRQARLWREQGLPPLRIAVNLSPRQFQQHDLAERVRTLIDQPDFRPSDLELEITESMVAHDVERAVATLRQLGQLGVRLSIDDFGTGYSSLAVLKRFPVNSLKVDRSFVCDVPDDADDVAITRAVIALALSLGLSVVAEGVETEAQRAFLVEAGCDEIQGFLFSKPLPAEELAALFREKAALAA